MEDEPLPVNVSLEFQDPDDIAAVFIGYEMSDGSEVIVASAEPPASADLKGTQPHSGSES